MRSKEADYCVRNNHEMTEEQQYAQMESEDKIAEEQAIKEMNEHNLAQATTTEQLEIAQKLNEMNNSHLEGH
jgi:mRNA degradation ribonuclease J1/J2